VEHASGAHDPEALGTALRDRIKQRIGVSTRVEVLTPHALERSLGKAKRISDER
jgi:phenylacetate-CoA ligase